MSRIKNHLHDDLQGGFVSFITVIFLAGILALMTTAFVRAMISNQRQTLDNQLNTQAFYAAESGVNDFLSYLSGHPGEDLPNNSTDNCNIMIDKLEANNPSSAYYRVLDSTAPIEYTCLLVDDEVDYISFKAAQDEGKLYKLECADCGSVVKKFSIEWGDSGQDGTLPTTKELPDKDSWDSWGNRPPMLRVSIYYPTSYNREELKTKTKTIFLMPMSTLEIANVAEAPSSDGLIYSAGCDISTPNKSPRCSANIDISGLLNASSGNEKVSIRVRPIYASASEIRIIGWAGNFGSNSYKLKGAQYSIDSTGRANDVYKRIEVRKDFDKQYDLPEFVVNTTDSICKQFVSYPDGGGSSDMKDQSGGACAP